jgi:L-ascorbate oxidase
LLHWHGILHPSTPWADGTPGVTELAIPPGDQRVYKFHALNAGTYFYHAHTRFHAVTAHGAFVVTNDHQEKRYFGYDEDRTLVFSEYYHDDVELLLDEDENMNMTQRMNIGDAILVNGMAPAPLGTLTRCNSTQSKCIPEAGCKMYTLRVTSGKTYRLRLINSGAKSALRIKLGKHKGLIMEIDGRNTQRTMNLDDVDLHIGQRYSVLMKADQRPGVYYATIAIEGSQNLKTTFRIVYDDVLVPMAMPQINSLFTFANITPTFDLVPVFHATRWYSDFPLKADRRIWLNITSPDGGFMVNGKRWRPPPGKSLLEMAYRNPDLVHAEEGVYAVEIGEVVDIIVQLGPTVCTSHPWHMHGHMFWDMGGGPGRYNPKNATLSRSPFLRDTVVIRSFPDDDHSQGCGWRILRLKVENAGCWHMHCHIHYHMVKGMQIVLAASLDQLPTLPKDTSVTERLYHGDSSVSYGVYGKKLYRSKWRHRKSSPPPKKRYRHTY